MQRRRPLAVLAAGLLVMAACGTATDGDSTATSATPVDDDSSSDDADDVSSAADDEQPSTDVTASTGDTSAPDDSTGDDAAADPAPDPGDGADTDADTDTDTASDDTVGQPDAPTWPDDGCSTDGSPTPVAAADGPAPAVEIRAESADSPFPDVTVRRINCKGGWENLRNEIPGEQILLVWFWAPH